MTHDMSLCPSANSISAGQLLCGGLFSADSLSNWCAAVALAHALQDNLTQKEQLLRVQLATSLGKPPVSLLQQCTNILSQVPSLNFKMWQCVFSWLFNRHFRFKALSLWTLVKGIETFGFKIFTSVILPYYPLFFRHSLLKRPDYVVFVLRLTVKSTFFN